MATTEVNTAETVPLAPLQKIEVDDKELITAEYDDSAKQFSKDELQKVKTEITKALETVEQLGDEETETTQVQNDAVDVRAQENVKDSEGRVFEELTSDPEVAEERTSTESHVHSGNEDKGELHINEKLEKLEESSPVGKQVDKVEEIDEPCINHVDKEEIEEPAGSQSDKEVPGAAGQTQGENIEFLEQKSHKEGETQGANESSHDSVKEASSVPFKQIEQDAENGTPEIQADISKEPASVPNVLHAENMEGAEESKELQGTKEKNTLIDPYKSKTDNNDSERDISVEVIAGDCENKESTSDTSTQHDKGVEKVPEQIQTGESLFVQTKELETEEKVTDSVEIEEHVLRSIDKLEDEPQLARSLKDDAEVENLESFPATTPEKIKEAEPSGTADKKVPDAEEHIINEYQRGEKDTNFTELTPTNETDTIQLDLDETENADVAKSIKEGSSSLTEETQSAEIEKIDDNEASRPKTEEEKERAPLTEITKTEGSPNVEAETGNLQSVELEIPQEIDIELAAVVKDAESEKADVVQVTEELQEVEEVHTVEDTKEVDIPPVISLTSEVNELSFEEKSKDDLSPTQHTEQLLQDEENKSEKREAIIEKVIDEPISTSIDDSKTEQTNTVRHVENLLTESHGEDVTDESLDDENEDSNKKEISEQLITEVSKVEEEPEKIASQNYKAEVELPESSLNSSTEEPEEIVTDDKEGTSIATTELTDKIDEQGNHASEYKTSDIESAREMNFQLTKTNENTGEAEAENLEHNADVKEMLSADQIPAETKDGVSDDSGLFLLPGEEKDDISATNKTVDGTPEENREEKETCEVRSGKVAELVEPHDIETSQISKDGDADTKDGEKTELAETAVDISSELPLEIESHQKEPSKDEEEDEKPSQLDETTNIAELVPVVTSAEIEDALGKDEDIYTSLSEQAPVEKDGHILVTAKEDPTSECNIQGIAEELPVESRGDTVVDYSEVPKEVTKNAEESVMGDATNPDELIVLVIGIQAHGTEEVSTQAEQIDDAASSDYVENKVQTSLEVVSEPDPNDSGYQEKITELDSEDSEKLKQVSEPGPDDSEKSEKVPKPNQDGTETVKQVSELDPDDLENLKRTSEPYTADSEKLEQVSEPDPGDSEYLIQTSDDSKILEHVSEPNPNDTEVLEEVSKPDSDHSEKFNQVSEQDHDDPEILEQVSKKELDHPENLTTVSEQDPDDTKTLKFSEPDPDNTEKCESVEKTNIPADCDQITIKAQPDSTNVDVFEKTDEEPREPTVSDEVNTVSVAEEPVTRSFEVNTSTAPEQGIEESVDEEENSHQIPELRTEEKSAPQTTQEQTEESEIEHVSKIQSDGDKEEKEISKVPDEHTLNEVEGAEGLSPPADAFVEDKKPDEADKEIEDEIKNVAADTEKDESDIPVTVVERDQTLIPAVEEQQTEVEFHTDEANELGQEPEHSQKVAEETEPSTLSKNDDGIPDLENKEAPEKVLQEEKEKEGTEEADNFAENISESEVLVQPHDNPGEETEQTPRKTEDTKLAVSTENDEKITSLNSEEQKEETQEVFVPEAVKEKEKDEPKNDDNVEEIKTADEVVVQDDERQPDKLVNEPEEVQQGLSVENEPEDDDNDTEISVEATTQQTEKEEIVHLSNDAEDTEIPSDNFTALKAEDINEAENEKDNDQANKIDTVHEIETATDINKEERIENVATETNKVESKIPITVVEADQILVQEVEEHHQEDEILKDEESNEEKEPEHLPESSASSSNDDGITHLVSKALPEEVLQEETGKDEVEDTGNVIEKTSVSEVLAQPHDIICEEAENLSSETVVTEMAPPVVNDEKITSLKSNEDEEETQKEVEPEIIIEDRKETDQQKTDDNVEQKQTVGEVVVPEDEQAKPDQMLNEPLGNEPSSTGLNDEDTVQREKGPEEVQEKLSVESQPEGDDNVTEKKVAEEAIVQQDKQRETVNLPNEAEHVEIPYDNFGELKVEEKENEEEEKDQDQAKENNSVHEIETATEVIIQEDQHVEQLQQSEDKEAELSTKGVNEKEIINPKNGANEIETTNDEVAQEIECLLGDSIASEPTGDNWRTNVLRTDEETEEILQDEKKAGEVNVDTDAKENANEEDKNEDDQCQFEHVSNEIAKLDPPVSYTSGEKQTNLEKDEAIEELEEKSKNDHTEVVDEKEIVSRELVFQEPSALLGNDDDIITLKNEESPEEVQEQKETKLAEVEAESFVEKSLVDENVVRGEEGPEQVEDEEQGKDQEIDENLTATKLSVEDELTVEEEKKGDELELEHYPKIIEDAELHASSSGHDKKCVQEIGDEVKVKDPSNEDSNLSMKELDAAAGKENNLDSKKPAGVEDNAKEHSTIEDGISSGILENKVETSNLETKVTKAVEETATADESNVVEDINEVITDSDALPTAQDKSNDEDGNKKGLIETEAHDVLESLPSVEVSDSEVQRDFAGTSKETKEEKLESAIPVAVEEDKKDLISTETHGENSQGSKGNIVPILGEETHDKFVITNTGEKELHTLGDNQVDVKLKETLNEASPEYPENEEETLGEVDQTKLTSSELLNDETTTEIKERETYVEAGTSVGSNTVEPEEISKSVLDKGDVIQREPEGDGNLPTIAEKSSLGHEEVTRATLETPVTEKVLDESAIELENTLENITKDEIIKENSVNEEKNLEPLTTGSSKVEELSAAKQVETKEALLMQEASLVTTHLEDELDKHECQAKSMEVTQKVEPEEENKSEQQYDLSSEMQTEHAKLREPETVIALVEEERAKEITSTELDKEETKGNSETQFETPNILEEVASNEVQLQKAVPVSLPSNKSETDQCTKSEVSNKIAEETKFSVESPQVSSSDIYAGDKKQINGAQVEELLENKMEPIIENEAVKFDREITDKAIQDLNTGEIKGKNLEELDLDKSNTNDADNKVNNTDKDVIQVTETPSAQVAPMGIPLEKLDANILEKQVGEEPTEKSKPGDLKSTEGVKEGTTCEDLIAIAEKKDDIKPSSVTEIQSTSRELASPKNKMATVLQTEGSDTNLGIQQLKQSTKEVPLKGNTHTDKNPKDAPTPVSKEKDFPTEVQQSTERSLDFTEVARPENSKKTESNTPLNITEESSLSDLLQISPKDTMQMSQQPNQETKSAPKKEDLQTDDPKTDEDKDNEDDEEEGDEHKKTDSSSDGVIVEASRDMDVKSPQKKHHGILSGVGIKVKNSISKVKKAITGKSSHPKPPSPK